MKCACQKLKLYPGALLTRRLSGNSSTPCGLSSVWSPALDVLWRFERSPKCVHTTTKLRLLNQQSIVIVKSQSAALSTVVGDPNIAAATCDKNRTSSSKKCTFVQIRAKNFEKDDSYKKAWQSNEDGKVVSNQPTRIQDPREQAQVGGGYIARCGGFLCLSCLLCRKCF